MPKYSVLEPLSHNQKDYAAGDMVEMAEDQAAALLAVSVIGEALADGVAPEPPDGKPSAAVAIAKAAAAQTVEELDALATGEARVTVLAAIEARRRELALAQE